MNNYNSEGESFNFSSMKWYCSFATVNVGAITVPVNCWSCETTIMTFDYSGNASTASIGRKGSIWLTIFTMHHCRISISSRISPLLRT